MGTERLPVLLADGPHFRATALRPLLDAAGFLSRPFRGENQGPALILVDPARHDARLLLALRPPQWQVRSVRAPEDPRELVKSLEEASLGLGAPDMELSARVASIASELAGAADTDAVLAEVATRARQLVEAEGASVFLLDADTGELVVRVVAGGAGSQLLQTRIPKTQGIVGHVIASQIPVAVNAPRKDPRFDHTLDERSGYVTRNLAAVPIFFRGEIVGVLELVNRATDFTPREVRALVELAQHVGFLLNHTRAAETLRASATAARQRSQDLETLVQQRTEVLTRAKREWEQTFDAIEDPLAVMDGFVVRRANKAYARRAGLHVTTVVGRKCYELLGRREPCPSCPLAKNPQQLHGEPHVRDGVTHAVDGFMLQDGGLVMHYRDITDERALEAKLRDADRLAVVGQLAAGAAHEINNPLGFVSSNIGSLESYFDDLAELATRTGDARAKGNDALDLVEDGRALISESRTGLQRVAEIVKALKELARQELGGPGEPVPLSTVAELAVRQLAPQHPRVRVVWSERNDAPVRGQPLQLQQAVSAVLKNALQAAQDGGGRVELAIEQLGAEARLHILDDGPGISEQHRARVFEPFFTTRGIGGGVGLGLTAAYGIVTRHGGRIELVPRLGGGTEAVIALPALSNAA